MCVRIWSVSVCMPGLCVRLHGGACVCVWFVCVPKVCVARVCVCMQMYACVMCVSKYMHACALYTTHIFILNSNYSWRIISNNYL